MQYDWSGVRTRRIARAKLALYLLSGIGSVAASVFILPELDFSIVVEALAADGFLELK